MLRIALVLLTLFFLQSNALPLHAIDVSPLGNLGRVWGLVKHAHPIMGQHEIDWDAAGVTAIRETLQSPGDESVAGAAGEDAAGARRPTDARGRRVQRQWCSASSGPGGSCGPSLRSRRCDA